MENPQFLPLSSHISNKALEKSPIESQKKLFRNLRINESSILRKSIERAQQTSLPQSPRSISAFFLQQNASILQGSIKNLSKVHRRPSLFQKTLQTVYGENQLGPSISSPKWTEEKSKFSTTLRKFSEILSNQTIQNRSPRKQTIKGAQQPFDSTKIQSITMRNIQTLEPTLKPRQLKHKRKLVVNQSLNLPQIYHVAEQTKRQKQAFYEMHPYFLKKDDTKRLQRRIDKRKNLLGLQELYLRLRNKQTSKIYKKK